MSGSIFLLLATVFLLAAISKIRDRDAFVQVVRKFLPAPAVQTIAWIVPALEIVLAAFLLSGIAPQTAVLAAIIVLLCFTVVLAQMWRRGMKGCACFGESEENATPVSGIVRNLALIALACIVLKRAARVSVIGPDASSLVARITLVAGALCLWSCLIALLQRRKFLFHFKHL